MKMEGIELYPHNQKAYDNLCAMLRDSNRACVVQPTIGKEGALCGNRQPVRFAQ